MKSNSDVRKLKKYVYAYVFVCLIILVCLFLLTNKLLFNLLGLPNILNTFIIVNGIDMFMSIAFIIILLVALFVFTSAISGILRKIQKTQKIK